MTSDTPAATHGAILSRLDHNLQRRSDRETLLPKGSAQTGSSPAPAKRRRRPTQEVTDLLRQAATEEFKRYGYATATTASIARKAGSTEAQLFRYFKSKAELFRESVFDELNKHFAQFNANNPPDDLPPGSVRSLAAEYIAELQQFLAEHHELLLALFVVQAHATEASPVIGDIDNLRVYFERGADLVARTGGQHRPPVDPRLMVRISFGAVLANVMFRSWLFPPGLATEEEIENATISFLLDGVSGHFPEAEAKPAPARKGRPKTS
jgi:AcrR family transcriptional regulator